MKKILSENDIAGLYFQQHSERCSEIWNVWNVWNVKIFNPDTFHFRKFKMKYLFLNQWKKFLNWSEKKFIQKLFPELSETRFEKKPLWWIVKQEFNTEIPKRYSYTYKQAVIVEKWFYKWLTGVVLKQSEMMWIPVDKYEVEIIEKTWTDIVEISWSDMRPAKKS